MLSIDSESVHRLATVESLIEPLRRSFSAKALGAERTHYDLGPDSSARTLLLMPAWRSGSAIGVKIVTVFPDNAARAIPTVNATYLLMSWDTGQPLAVIDGRALTLLRTAAVSALAADLLAPPHPDTLLMVGTGSLSRFFVEGHLAVRNYKSILVWGRDPVKAARVVRDLDNRGLPVRAASHLEAAARSADVISCATMAERPLIHGAWLKARSHLDLVGSFTADMREADDECMRGAFLVVDTLSAVRESGDLIVPLARGVITADSIHTLEEMAAARVPGPRHQRTVFKSVGVAHADLAVGMALYQRHGGG